MGDKIEKLIRDDFNKRKINPSANALERLNAKLDTQIHDNHKKSFRILAYAASIAGLIFLLQYVFRSNKSNINNGEITNVELKDSINLQGPNNENYIPVTLESLDTISNKITNATIKKQQNNISVHAKFVSVSKEELHPKITEHTPVDKKVSLKAFNEKEVVAINDTIKPRFKLKTISDKELDALLASAARSLPQKVTDSIEINAQSMLYEIEVEINQPLPEKVFLTLKTGVNTFKTLIK